MAMTKARLLTRLSVCALFIERDYEPELLALLLEQAVLDMHSLANQNAVDAAIREIAG